MPENAIKRINKFHFCIIHLITWCSFTLLLSSSLRSSSMDCSTSISWFASRSAGFSDCLFISLAEVYQATVIWSRSVSQVSYIGCNVRHVSHPHVSIALLCSLEVSKLLILVYNTLHHMLATDFRGKCFPIALDGTVSGQDCTM